MNALFLVGIKLDMNCKANKYPGIASSEKVRYIFTDKTFVKLNNSFPIGLWSRIIKINLSE